MPHPAGHDRRVAESVGEQCAALYAGSSSLQLRFVFGSNGTNQFGGWYIDYIHILGTGA